MNEALKNSITQRIAQFPGHTSFFFKNLVTGETFAYNEKEPLVAASVIKLTVMAELFRAMEAGEIDGDQLIASREEDKVPICGVLTLMHTGTQLTPVDLCWLMITISDNMATNMLIDLLGEEKIMNNIRALGLEGVELNRKLFETRPGFREKRNWITAAGIGKLLEMIYRGQLVSENASKKMMDMLLAQQCTNKMPLLLPGEGVAAHKTGEDDTITHDTGIVFAREPFVACFCNGQLEMGTEGQMNILIGQITRELFDACGGLPEEA